MISLLDGDIICYRCAASCEPNKSKSEREPLELALLRTEDLVKRILHETKADSYKIYLGGSTNFRTAIDPNYKANRADMPKPMWLQDVRAYLVTEWNAEITDNIEADDALGIEQTKLTNQFGLHSNKSVICSIDKDLHMIIGNHYNFVKQEWKLVTPDYAIKWFYQQLIQGDSSDNVMGFDNKARPKIPQFLQPTITRLWDLSSEQEMLSFVFYLYHDKDKFKTNGQLLWIKRVEEEFWLDYLLKNDLQIK